MNYKDIPENIQMDIVDSLSGTCSTITGRIKEIIPGITEDDIIEIMIDHGYEMCPLCGSWSESSGMKETDYDTFVCEDCYEEYYGRE